MYTFVLGGFYVNYEYYHENLLSYLLSLLYLQCGRRTFKSSLFSVEWLRILQVTMLAFMS